MTDPIVMEFDVAAPAEHAFSVWAERTAIWWPRGHTISDEPSLTVVFEPFAGGRIYERSREGAEHDWGQVVVWDPPQRITYLWHLFFEPSEATEVEVSFTPIGDGTRVRIEHTGWDQLGREGSPRRNRTEAAWSVVVPFYREAV